MTDGKQLLVEYARTGSETAFRDLVSRYVDLVYSAAVRMVNGDAHLAQDITQTVFADLARKAPGISQDVMLGGWLHRHTCYVASNTIRKERRRQVREQQAVEMNSIEDHSAANLAQIAPVLDEAINQLGAEDRAAIMLRYFEQQDFRAVGQSMGNSEEAARKRVDRALDKLQGLLKKRGIALSAAALGSTLATQAVIAAPAGVAVAATSFALAGAAASGGTFYTIIQVMSMTKIKVGVIGAVVVAGIGIPWALQHKANNKLQEAAATIRQQQEEIGRLAGESERLSNLLAQASQTREPAAPTSTETLRLRGEVGRLRQSVQEAEAKQTGPSALGGMTMDPEMRQVIRDQQKMAMTQIYSEFTNRMKLLSEQGEQFNNLLADDIMDNVELVIKGLGEKKTAAQMSPLFAAQQAALNEKVRTLIGEEGLSKYKEYTRDLASHLTAMQFSGKFSGEKEEKEAKTKQMFEIMQDETRKAISAAGLPQDYQLVPSLNFQNIAFEEEGEKSLKLLEGIYGSVAERAESFLSPEEVTKFKEFRAAAININRMSLSINRKMMSPGSGK